MSDNHPDRDLLQEYAFNCLDDAEAVRVRAHLDVCETCRGQVDEVEGLLGNLSLALPGVDPPADLEQKLMRRIEESAAAQLRGVPRTGSVRRRYEADRLNSMGYRGRGAPRTGGGGAAG